MRRILVAPHNMGSGGAKSLAHSLGGKVTKAQKRLRHDVVLVNWGRSDLVVKGGNEILNKPNAVARAANKLSCLQALKGARVSAVPFTTDRQQALEWIRNGDVVYGRKVLNGSSGKGIVVMQQADQMQSCPLYTKGVIKSHEYRVHVLRNQIIDVTKKRRRKDEDTNDFVKNLDNGWVYCREDIDPPEEIMTCARNAVKALGLDFGAVDILWKKSVPYVLEINTAPGLEGTTLERYTEAFAEMKE